MRISQIAREMMIITVATVLSGAVTSAAGSGLQQWSVSSTAPVAVTLPAEEAPRSAWSRAGDGRWSELPVSLRDGRMELSLSAEQMAGGTALIVLDPPAWLSLEDAGPPLVELFEVDGKVIEGRETVELGWLDDMPQTVLLRVRDADNPLDRDSIHVRASTGVFGPRDPGVEFRPDGVRGGALMVCPPDIPGLETATRASVELMIDDYAIDDAVTRRTVSWSLSPRMRLDDGGLLIVDSLTSSAAWSDWSVIADDVVMTEADTTTRNKTWLSDQHEREHWIRWQFDEPRAVAGVTLAWPYYQVWRTSRDYDVQTWDGERWVTRIEVRDQSEKPASEHRFDEPVSSTSVRVLQHPMGGQAGRQDLMWLAEADVIYGE